MTASTPDPAPAAAALPYGVAEPVSPLVTRVLAHNPSPFTMSGTGTFIVGTRSVAVIDPGPEDPAHLAALQAAIGGREVAAILVTHTHKDHSPLARALAAATGAPVMGCAPLVAGEPGQQQEEGFDTGYAPDRVLEGGEAVEGEGWTLSAVHTPGHTSNHLCFALAEEAALFSGDHVMGWSTTVIIPPDGSMRAYMASLDLLAAREDRLYYPTHGPAVDRPRSHVRGLILHRRQREAQILRQLGEGATTIPAMVERMYANVDRRLWVAAGQSVLSHLIDLAERGLVTAPEPGLWAKA